MLTIEFLVQEYNKLMNDPSLVAAVTYALPRGEAQPWEHIPLWLYHKAQETGETPPDYMWQEWIDNYNRYSD